MTGNSLIGAACAAWALFASPADAVGQVSWRQSFAEKLAALREGRVDRPLLHMQQTASLRHVYYRSHSRAEREALDLALPDEAEKARFFEMQKVSSPRPSIFSTSSTVSATG